MILSASQCFHVLQNSQFWSHLYQIFGISFFFDKAGWMVNFEIVQYTVCTYILNAHFSSNLCLQAPYETSWEANLVITMCWEQARFSWWWQHLPRLVATIKILCWLCGNHWLCRNCWFRLCRNLRVGAAGPPKYSTPWLVWTPINFFLLLTFLFFWGNPYEAIQPVKTTIFSFWKITFERELASYWPVLLHYSWIFDSGTLTQIVSAVISSWKLDACY